MQQQDAEHSSTLGRVLKYTGIFGGVQGLYALLAMVRNKVTAELLSTMGLGLIGNFNKAVDLLGAATNCGLSFSAIQHISRLHAHGNERALQHYATLMRSWVLIVAAVGTLLMAAGAPLWSLLYFESLDHTTHFLALAPLVALTTLSGGEMAVLKGMRRIKSIAWLTTLTAIATLVVTVSIYVGWGIAGIVPSLVACGTLAFLLQARAAHHVLPYRVRPLSWKFLRRGRAMLRLGSAYALANFVAFGGESAVLWFITRFADEGHVYPRLSGLDAVGIYGVGIALTVTYARLIFTSLDSEYYPRLSAACREVETQNTAVNRQIDALVLIISPFILLLALLLPLMVQVLYTSAFMPAIPMVLGAALSLFFKATSTPIAYLALAHAKSKLYLAVEVTYSAVFVASVSIGFYHLGFLGAGIGLSVSYLLYFFTAWGIYRRQFGFALSPITLRRIALQLLILVPGLCAIGSEQLPLRYAGGGVCLLLSGLVSWHILKRETALPARLQRLFHAKSANTKH